LIDLRWVTSPYMLRFIAAVVLFRIVLSEQTVGVVGLMTVLGQTNEQMRTLFSLATLGILFGFFIAIVLALRKGTPWLGAMAALLVMVAAWMDSNTTSLTRPAELYLTQTMISAGLGTFFAAAVLLGLLPAVQEGRNLVSFVAMFSLAQYLGSVLGTAWIQSLVHMRQQWHYAALVQHLTLADPQVAARIAQLGGSVARVVGDHQGRASQALTLLAQQVTRESFVLAYNDVFQNVAFISAGMLVWLMWIGWRRARRQAATSN
jgi:hypothetical protein